MEGFHYFMENSYVYMMSKKCIKINGSISSLGMHIVTLNLHKKVVGELKVHLIEK